MRDYLYCTSLLKGRNFSADVMLGLKGQTTEDIRKTIELVAVSGAKHVSMYALTPEDGTPIYTDYLNGELPDGDEVREMYDFGVTLLKKHGYLRYEVSNFSKPGFESRHNLNYWRRGEYIGMGVSASSFLNGHRFTNTFDLDEYMKCILSGFFPILTDEEVKGEEAKFEFVMLALRTARGISSKERHLVQRIQRRLRQRLEGRLFGSLPQNASVLHRRRGHHPYQRRISLRPEPDPLRLYPIRRKQCSSED